MPERSEKQRGGGSVAVVSVVAHLQRLGDQRLQVDRAPAAQHRAEHRTEDGEAKRDDANFTFVSAWEYTGENKEPIMHKEDLVFENVELKTRSYK